MNKFKIKFFLIFFIFSACSLDNKSGVAQVVKRTSKPKEEIKIKLLFKDEKVLNKEFNKNFKVNLKNNFQTDTLKANYHNNLGRYNYDKPLDKISKFKFSKIKNFHQNDPEIIFDRTDIIFFDDKGSVIKFDKFSKVKWKKNYYIIRRVRL